MVHLSLPLSLANTPKTVCAQILSAPSSRKGRSLPCGKTQLGLGEPCEGGGGGGKECLCPGLVSMGPVLGKGQIASDRTWRAGASLWSEEEATS